jgi:2-amino-4-hydroxy-6-hydroxymethyldihydropteridine diphosphokinase
MTTPSRKSRKRSKKRWTPATTSEDAGGAAVAIGLGGNVGDPLHWFRVAANVFATMIDDLAAAALYRSDAIAGVAQPPYLNTVLVGTTRRPAADLLAVGKALEHAAGRRLGPRHAPRPLDVDLLLYGDRVTFDPELRLPHPALRERRFALQPLAELDPDRRLPPDGKTAIEVLARLRGAGKVERLGRWLVGERET